MTSPELSQISLTAADGIMTVTLDRTDRLNAWTPTMQRELLHVFDLADADDDVRVIVVTGAGRCFCAGADIGPQAEPFRTSSTHEPPSSPGGEFSLRVFEARKPVIAAINGPAVGIGVTMTLPMDIRIASTEARLGFLFARRGLVPDAASSWFLPRIVGVSRAMEWIAGGRMIDAEEGLDAGLIRSVHEPRDLLPAAHALAAELSDGTAPVAVALSRRLLWGMLAEPHPRGAQRIESRILRDRLASADFAEGVRAFSEKRRPRFTDRVSDEWDRLEP